MRDVPGWIWILAIFAVGAFGVFIYGKTAPDLLPAASSPWSLVETARNDIARRSIQLGENEKVRRSNEVYDVKIERLGNIEEPRVFGRYVIRIRTKALMPEYLLWNPAGLDVAYMDRDSQSAYGDLELISVRKVKKGPEE